MLVEVGVVDAHPPLVRVLLADEDGVGEPLRMEDFFDEAGRESFGEFLLDGVPSVVGETAEVLSLGGSFRIDVEGMLDQLPGHPWHVSWLPREDVAVSPEEVDERIFLFGVETCPDGGGLAAVACPEVDCLDQNLIRWLRLVSFVRLLRDVEFTWGKLLRCT
jgi:hypothetical protein